MLSGIKDSLKILGLRLLKKSRVLNRVNFFLTYPGHAGITIPIAGGKGYEHFFEKKEWLSVLLGRWLKQFCGQACFFDVGVNTGQTLIKVKAIDPSVRYIGFEPNPNCLYYLHELLKVNRFEHVTIYPVALGDFSGILDLQLFSQDATDSSASLVPGFRSEVVQKMKIAVFDPAALRLPEGVMPGIIKIDVEGGEFDVLRGLREMLAQCRPLVVCEVLPVYKAENTRRLTRQEGLESILKSTDYGIALIGEDGSLTFIESIGIHSDIARVNYVFYPRERSLT